MKPITFTVSATLPTPAEAVADAILDLDRWPEFDGYAFLPGIVAARFATRTDDVVGTRIQVENSDGSRHVEEIVVWEPGRAVSLRFGDFENSPVGRLATHFLENWQFEPRAAGTFVRRRMTLYPRNWLAALPLWFISGLLRRALGRHLAQMAVGSDSG